MKPRKFVVLDIETAPISDALLSMTIPQFNSEDVKTGNLVDPAKIAAKLSEAKADHFDSYKRSAALSAMTGSVIAVGIDAGTPKCLLDASEPAMLAFVWETIQNAVLTERCEIVGWNITNFDLPYLCRRSYRHKISPPSWLRDGRYWHNSIVDLLDVWRMGEPRQVEGQKRISYSLDNVARFLGLEGKNGSGKDFAALLETDRAAAESYLLRDLDQTKKIAQILLPP